MWSAVNRLADQQLRTNHLTRIAVSASPQSSLPHREENCRAFGREARSRSNHHSSIFRLTICFPLEDAFDRLCLCEGLQVIKSIQFDGHSGDASQGIPLPFGFSFLPTRTDRRLAIKACRPMFVRTAIPQHHATRISRTGGQSTCRHGSVKFSLPGQRVSETTANQKNLLTCSWTKFCTCSSFTAPSSRTSPAEAENNHEMIGPGPQTAV
ncbi:hypothetical protein HDK64DRAFT_84050 [Phyllosticta capitalensis]